MDFHFFLLFIAFAISIGIVCTTSGRIRDHKVVDELKFVHTICRHGDRNIYEPYPNDPWKSEKYWPGGFAQLTKVGMQQHYALGQYLRKRYTKLLGNDDYSVDKVFVYSTDTDRTLMSAEVCLASLFVAKRDQIWNEKLVNWQPVPVHTKPRNEESVVTPEKPCDRYEYEMIKYTNSSAYKSLFVKNKELIRDLEKKSGTPLNSLRKLIILYDTLSVEKLKGFRIPLWGQKIIEPGSNFEHLSLQFYRFFTQTSEMKKLRTGYLLKEILDRSKNKTMSTLSPNRSMWLYFAHDITVVDVLNSLGLYKLHTPPYASCLFFELYGSNDSAENYLQLFYRNSTHTIDIPPLEIPNCGPKCSLNKWYLLYGDILPTKGYDEECKLTNGELIHPDQNPEHFFK